VTRGGGASGEVDSPGPATGGDPGLLNADSGTGGLSTGGLGGKTGGIGGDGAPELGGIPSGGGGDGIVSGTNGASLNAGHGGAGSSGIGVAVAAGPRSTTAE
jgi:hypothetical protein